ncbi:MAG: ComF family protein [Spirochaetes bacterium]|nr:ComF family protein [Spirochaetota bacterium]
MANSKFITLLHYAIFDTVFPSFCAYCGKMISINDSGVCYQCCSKLEKIIQNYSGEYIFSLEESIHGKRQWFLDSGVWLFKYEEPIPTLIYDMKFKYNKSIANLFAQYCIMAISLQKWQFDYITYVPVSNDRLWKRGFNQSELIAQHVSKACNKDVLPLFYLKNEKAVQKKLSSNERFINTYNKFGIYTGYDEIKNKSLLIVDDVYTTGATINECARLLKQQGVRNVFACIVAYAMLREMVC